MCFFPKNVEDRGEHPHNRPMELKQIEGPTTNLTDVIDGVVVDDFLYVYDKAVNKVFQFPISAQGDLAPTKILDPGSLNSEVIKVKYSSFEGKILLILSDGLTKLLRFSCIYLILRIINFVSTLLQMHN